MKQITKYKCDFCKRSYINKYKAREHEKRCFFNPAVKSCVTCKHKDIKSTFDEEGNCIDATNWCFVMEHEIFRKGYPVKHCIGWQQEESEVECDA